MKKLLVTILLIINTVANASCLQDYTLRKDELKHKATLGLAKNTAIATGSTGAFTLGFGYLLWSPGPMAGISYAVGAIGWGVPAFATVIGIETAALVNLAKSKKLIKIIEQSYSGEGKEFEAFAKKVIRKTDGAFSVDQVANVVKTADSEGKLCDASLVSSRKQRLFKKKGKLKHKLSSKKEMIKFLFL